MSDGSRRDKRYRRDNYLVSVRPAVGLLERREGYLQRAGPAVAHDAKAAAVEFCELALESLRERAIRQAIVVESLQDELFCSWGDAQRPHANQWVFDVWCPPNSPGVVHTAIRLFRRAVGAPGTSCSNISRYLAAAASHEKP